jgi:hypothetical protein
MMFGLPSWLVNSLVRGADSAQTSYSIVILVLGGVPWELGHVGQLGHVLGGETWKTHFRGKKSRILSLPDRRKGRKKRVAAHRAGEKLRRLFPGRTGGGEFTAPSPGGFVRSRCVVRPGEKVSGTFFLTGQACFVKLAAWGDRIAPAEEPKKVPDTFSCPDRCSEIR